MATDLLSTATPALADADRPGPLAGPALPVFLDLEQRRVLLVGGGSEALAQLSAVLYEHPQAAVTIVAPHFLPELSALSMQHPHVVLRAQALQRLMHAGGLPLRFADDAQRLVPAALKFSD